MEAVVEGAKQYYRELKEVFARPRQLARQVIHLGCVVFSALMFWKILMLSTGSVSPVVVVLSGSMEPGFYRGDILLLNYPATLHVGDVVVFQIEDREVPIVHRTLDLHESPQLNLSMLTKGDNNDVDDRGLYAKRQLWITKESVMGIAQGFIPYAGMMTIWLNDYVWLKYLTIGGMALLVILGKE